MCFLIRPRGFNRFAVLTLHLDTPTANLQESVLLELRSDAGQAR